MKIPLDRIEAQIKAVIEGRLTTFLPQDNRYTRLAAQLVEAMQDNLSTQEDQSLSAPNAYILWVSAQEIEEWSSDPSLLGKLAGVLEHEGHEAGITFALPPTIRIVPDPDLPPGGFNFEPDQENDSSFTSAVRVSTVQRSDLTHVPPNAFFFVDGKMVFPLDQSVISIGRRSDNQLVIPDPRVSRTHAMLRAVNQQYILFDLNSTGGTFINGERINQAALKSGDVISLAGFPLVYGVEDQLEPPGEEEQTRSMQTHPLEDPFQDLDGEKKETP